MPPHKTRAKPRPKPRGNPESRVDGPTAGSAAPPATGERMNPPAAGVKVRMYRTGLGDCFLLALPKTATAADGRDVFYILIDCGVFYGTPGGNDWIRTIAADIKAATRETDDGDSPSRIDVLAVTHEHWDHVSGFHKRQAQDIFKTIGLGVLWMAWTEDLRIDLARQLHSGRKTALRALATVAHQHFGDRSDDETAALVNKVLGFFAVGAGDGLAAAEVFAAKKSVMTEEAMLWLKNEYGKGKTEFLHPGGPAPLVLPVTPEARVYVLGPPEDSVLIRLSDPKGDEV